MEENKLFGAIESVLYVSGEPVSLFELQTVFELTKERLIEALNAMNEKLRSSERGVLLFITDESVQLITNPVYDEWVVKLLEPPEERTLSNSLLETLSLIAYRQPVTRADIDEVRGVKCDYSVSQLLKQGFIRELGRKDCIGHPMLFGTTDAFLRRFGLHSLDELPKLPESAEERADALGKLRKTEQASETGETEENAAQEEKSEQIRLEDIIGNQGT